MHQQQTETPEMQRMNALMHEAAIADRKRMEDVLRQWGPPADILHALDAAGFEILHKPKRSR